MKRYNGDRMTEYLAFIAAILGFVLVLLVSIRSSQADALMGIG